MFAADGSDPAAKPLVLPLGESALLVRFGSTLSQAANTAALRFARILELRPIAGVVEVVPNLVSVLLRYEPQRIGFHHLAGEIGLLLTAAVDDVGAEARNHIVKVAFGGEAGPDLPDVAERLGLSAGAFVAAHNASRLRVLATGFAPGFVYCGFHPERLHVPRRAEVRPRVAAGSVLFAAGQTAIAATDIPTGWHVIGHTQLRNFDALRDPPTLLQAGDTIEFEATT
ncbi:5-oxoprolinase subunit B family protein [Devosia nitrariae]|uniref:Allophanate hydrolase n=1 Tax=Devosia nitrariae TaxID=2071872 RepID=A0ABQ5WCR6_9HYPH|nr:allophanate hydrolase subunit 1 [Devosia nitrariae]GLQ57663.1 allophanate hydrolase [Devosia nitrariae]